MKNKHVYVHTTESSILVWYIRSNMGRLIAQLVVNCASVKYPYQHFFAGKPTKLPGILNRVVFLSTGKFPEPIMHQTTGNNQNHIDNVK